MPLCACKPPEPEKQPEPEPEPEPASAPEPVQQEAPASTFSGFSSFSGFGSQTAKTYNLQGSKQSLSIQCRDAVKSKDSNGVKVLLEAKADPNFGRLEPGARPDPNGGTTLVQLAALFNDKTTLELLVKAGADLGAKNTRGETAYKLAPPSLQIYLQTTYPPSQ